ncbi:MAG: protein kinase, partial [Planctomycetales bacterium]|nr:protein kinase [Planctomycetales bacterium]
MTTSLHRAAMRPAAPRLESPSATKSSHPVLGGWELGTEIGTGRWAKVFSARQAAAQTPGSDYALKTLKDCSAKELSFQQGRSMLQREALIGRQVSHPHLAPVLDWQLKGQPFIVMPRIHGCTLRTLLEHRRREYGCLIGATKFLSQSV